MRGFSPPEGAGSLRRADSGAVPPEGNFPPRESGGRPMRAGAALFAARGVLPPDFPMRTAKMRPFHRKIISRFGSADS